MGKTTLEKGGRDPPDVTLKHIAEDVSKYFKGFPKFKKYKNEIEDKYDIKIQHDDCWTDDDIKKVWGKTQRLAITSKRRKCLSQAIMMAIMLQLINKPLDNDEEVNAESESQHSASNEKEEDWQEGKSNKHNHMYIRIPLSVMSDKILSDKVSQPEVKNVKPTHKLIDRVPKLTEIRKKKTYVMLYDNQTRNATWVYEILNKSTIKDKKPDPQKQSRRPRFKVDESINKLYQASNYIDAFRNSAYNQGHLAAAANHNWCQEAYEDTFLISNMTPQNEYFNKNIWENLESYCRNIVKNKKWIRNVHVYTGPLYLPIDENSTVVNYEMMGEKAVPTHFFKVIIKEYKNGNVTLECYKIPNKEKIKKNFKDHKVKIEEIEKDSGLIFTEKNSEKGGFYSIRIVTWKEKKGNKTASTKVRINIPLTDYEDCARSV